MTSPDLKWRPINEEAKQGQIVLLRFDFPRFETKPNEKPRRVHFSVGRWESSADVFTQYWKPCDPYDKNTICGWAAIPFPQSGITGWAPIPEINKNRRLKPTNTITQWRPINDDARRGQLIILRFDSKYLGSDGEPVWTDLKVGRWEYDSATFTSYYKPNKPYDKNTISGWAPMPELKKFNEVLSDE